MYIKVARVEDGRLVADFGELVRDLNLEVDFLLRKKGGGLVRQGA